jgi:hypothetical protein
MEAMRSSETLVTTYGIRFQPHRDFTNFWFICKLLAASFPLQNTPPPQHQFSVSTSVHEETDSIGLGQLMLY